MDDVAVLSPPATDAEIDRAFQTLKAYVGKLGMSRDLQMRLNPDQSPIGDYLVRTVKLAGDVRKFIWTSADLREYVSRSCAELDASLASIRPLADQLISEGPTLLGKVMVSGHTDGIPGVSADGREITCHKCGKAAAIPSASLVTVRSGLKIGLFAWHPMCWSSAKHREHLSREVSVQARAEWLRLHTVLSLLRS